MPKPEDTVFTQRIIEDADIFLNHATAMAKKHFGHGVVDAKPELTASIAAMMMENYSALLLYDGLARVTMALDAKKEVI